MVKLKICGVSRTVEIGYVNAVKPDYCGFVFIKTSRRFVSPDVAQALALRLDRRITPVGVFADADVHQIVGMCNRNVIRAVQLNGSETDAYIEKLRGFVNVPVIKTARMDTPNPLFPPKADFWLLDSADGARPFNWAKIGEMHKPWFLAGVTLENLDQALALNPYALDVSGGVETNGFKDWEKLSALTERLRH